MNSSICKRLALILIVTFLITALPWRELRADANTHGEYNCSSLSITYDQTSTWGLTTQGEYVVTNISEETVNTWTLQIEFASDLTITNIWNGQERSDDNTPANILVIGNEVYNGVITPGESVSFGVVAQGISFAPVAPISVSLITGDMTSDSLGENTETASMPDPSTYVVFSASNTSDLVISGWRSDIEGNVYSGKDFIYQCSEFGMDGMICAEGAIDLNGCPAQILENASHQDMPDLSGEILSKANELTILDDSEFASQADIISDGYYYSSESVTINSQTFGGEVVIVSETDIEVNVDSISGNGHITLYSIDGDITINGSQSVFNGTLYAPHGSVTLNAYDITVIGKIIADEFSYSGTKLTVTTDPNCVLCDPDVTVVPTPTEMITPTPTVTPTPAQIDVNLDSDGDLLPDYLEDELGTNPNDPDTDGDGLGDYLELMIGYDPTIQDSDGNGTLDGDEDQDGDGLSNIVELNADLDILSEDSDCDGLKDGEEVNLYGTDPNDPDSDDDSILDGDEILLGKDPSDSGDASVRIEQTKEQQIDNEEDPAVTSVEVTIALANTIDRSLEVTDMYNRDMYITDVEGRIGSPVSFECEEDFDSATVVFHYNESALGETEESDLGVLWYDEENGIFVMQDQAIVDTENNTVTVELEHFSRYTLVDRSGWTSSGPNVYLAEGLGDSTAERNGIDVYITVHLDDNTTQEDKLEMIRCIDQILELTEDGDRYYFAVYDDSHVYSNREYYTSTGVILGDVRSEIMNFQGISIQAWVQQQRNSWAPIDLVDIGNDALTINLFASNRNASSSLSSGVAIGITYTDLAPVVVSGAFRNEVYGVNLNIRHDNTEQMNDIRRLLGLESINATDSDGDGLPDVLEEEGMYATNHHKYYSDPEDPNSDEDSLSDGEEMGTVYSIHRISEDKVLINYVDSLDISSMPTSEYSFLEQYIPENVDEICYVFKIQSNPSDSDSDNDEFYDDEDGIPFEINPDIAYILYSANGSFYLQTEAYIRHMNYTYDVLSLSVSDSTQFKNYWNSMGVDDEGRYIKRIREVVTVFHGFSQIIDMDNNPEITGSDIEHYLTPKRIDTLRLSSCNNGDVDDANNVARKFMEWGTIGEVYAWDGQSAYIVNGEIVLLLPSSDEWLGNNYFALDLSVEFSASNLRNYIIIGLVGSYSSIRIINRDGFDLGMVRYYRDSSGRVVYENVPDSSINSIGLYCG